MKKISQKEYQKLFYQKDHKYLIPKVSNYTNKLSGLLVSSLNLKPNDDILEIGCGMGRFTLPLLEKSLRITGIDLSLDMLERLRKFAGKNPNLTLIKGDVDKLSSFTNKKFDAIIGFFILHHLENLDKSFESIHRRLKKNGQVGFIEPNLFNPLYYFQFAFSKDMSWEGEKGILNMTKANITKKLSNNGFEVTNFKYFGFFPPFIVNSRIGFYLNNFAEKIMPIKSLLPFILITAKFK